MVSFYLLFYNTSKLAKNYKKIAFEEYDNIPILKIISLLYLCTVKYILCTDAHFATFKKYFKNQNLEAI